MTEFGKLERVDLYDAWPHEAHDFTPWLANNLDRLSEVIGIPLELEGTELPVGPFAADIVATNRANGSRVLIENQLTRSDHKHLGQIMTYAAGVKAQTVVWIAGRFRQPHLDAVRWYNEHAQESLAFLAVHVRVVRIAGTESPVIPIFEVLAKPSEWDRKTSAWNRGMCESVQPAPGSLAQFRHDFWAHYRDRHPNDGVPEGHRASSFWVRIKSARLILAPYLAYGVVGVWVRGERKESPDLVQDRIRRWGGRLWDQLGVQINEPTSWGSSAGRHYRINTRDADNWPKAADWLHAKIVAYRRILKGPPDEDPEESTTDEAE